MDIVITYNGELLTKPKTVIQKVKDIATLVKATEGMPQLEAPVTHNFEPGKYIRKILMSKDTLVIGKIHKTKHINIISKGRCTVVTPLRRLEITAPFTFESFEGEQKVVLLHEDTEWTTIHETDETDLVKLEEECITKEFDQALINNLMTYIGV